MATVSISGGLSNQSALLAEQLAERLSHHLLSREVLIEASAQFNLQELKLKRAIENAPSILDRFFYGKEKYVAYIRETILSRLTPGDVIYNGLAGHFFLQGIPHILKIQVISDLEDRIQEEVNLHQISRSAAKKLIEKDDEERRRWGLHLYGLDTKDPSLYDLVINLSSISIKEAVDIICQTLKLPRFQSNRTSEQVLANKLMEASIFSILAGKHPHAIIHVTDGIAYVTVKTGNFSIDRTKRELEALLFRFRDKVHLELSVDPILEAG